MLAVTPTFAALIASRIPSSELCAASMTTVLAAAPLLMKVAPASY
jgi:hypothetical protein